MFVTIFGNGTVGEYSTSGDILNPALIENLNSVQGIAAIGNQLFVVNGGNVNVGNSGYISEYTLGAAPGTIASSIPFLITGLAAPEGIAIAGSALFVAEHDSGTIAEYSLSGEEINASFITGLNGPGSLAVSGDDLFVATTGNHTIGEYTTSGETVNAALITGLTHGMRGLAVAPLEDPPSLLDSDPSLEVTPEPGTCILLSCGLMLLAVHRFRTRPAYRT